MNSNLIHPGERLDDLLIHNLKIIQNERGFCFSLDAVLLAQFACVRPSAKVVDLGAGTGVIGLLLTTRGAGKIVGLEINPDMANMATRSVEFNQLSDTMEVRQADFRHIKGELVAGEWDLVVSNPPYRTVGGGFISPNDKVACACHEVTANLQDVINAARYLVKYRGRFAMSHLPERMADVLCGMREAGIEPKRLRLVQPKMDKKPNIMLVEGIRGAKPGLEILPPLVVYQSDGDYTEEILGYYK